MDKVDEEILSILEQDGRASYTEIASRVGVSEGTVRNRIEKMRETGVIEKFTVQTSRPESVTAFVSVDASTERDFDRITEEFPENTEIYEVAGDTDMLVKIARESSKAINQAVDKIRAVKGVENTKTYMVLSERS